MSGTSALIAFGPWASVLVAVFIAWAHIVSRLAVLEAMIEERKIDIDRRFKDIEARLAAYQPRENLDLLVRHADEEHDRMWEAINALRGTK